MTACDYCLKPATEQMAVAGKSRALCARCATGERRARAATILPFGYDQAAFERDVDAIYGPKPPWQERQAHDFEAAEATRQQRIEEARDADRQREEMKA